MVQIDKVVKLTAGTTAETVTLGGRPFMLQNLSTTTVVYFKEKRHDNAAATASNGYAVGPGKETTIPMVAMDLSVISDTASTDVRVLILEEV